MHNTVLHARTPEGYINRDTAAALMSPYYSDLDQLNWYLARVWGAMSRASSRGQIPFDGYCLFCGRHVSSRVRSRAHMMCGLDGISTDFIFTIQSILDNAERFLTGGPFKLIGPSVKQDFDRLRIQLEAQAGTTS